MGFRLSCALLAAVVTSCVPPGLDDSEIQTELVAPALLVPVAGDSLVRMEPQFQWRTVVGASVYRLQLATDAQYRNLILDTVVADTSIMFSGMENMRSYSWRVRANRQSDTGAWSERTFRVFAGFQVFNTFKAGDTWIYKQADRHSRTSPWYTTVTGDVFVTLSALMRSGDSILYALTFNDTLCTQNFGNVQAVTCKTATSADTVIFNAAMDSVIRSPSRIYPLFLPQATNGVRLYALQEGEELRAVAADNPNSSGYDSAHYVEGYGLVRVTGDFYDGSTRENNHLELTLQAFNGSSVPTANWTQAFP